MVWAKAGRFGARPSERLKYFSRSGEEQALKRILLERIEHNLPTLVRVDYGVDGDLTYNHFVVCVGATAEGDLIMNDPASRLGDGYEYPFQENLIERTSRKQGYRIVRIDGYDRVAAA